MIKMNGGRPATTPSCATAFNNSDCTNQCKIMEIKSVNKNSPITSVFSMSPHYHWTEFAYNSCRVALAAREATNGSCSHWKNI